MKFIFDKKVHDLGVRGIYFNIRGLHNQPSADPVITAFVDEHLARISHDLEASDIIQGFHELHAAVSDKPDRLISAPANLLAFYRAKKGIPRINGIVDVYNSISVASGLAVGAHDLAFVDGDIELRLTEGDETFWPLGASKIVEVPSGEYGYIDAKNEILCRLEVRQVEKTKVTLASQDVFFIVQGHTRMDHALIEQTANELMMACKKIFGGSVEKLYP